MAKSYYEILEVDSKATEAEIRKAYRIKIREFHPDLNPDKVKSNKRTRQLNVALEVLTSPEKRKRYDEKLLRMGKEKANAEFDFTGKKDQAKGHEMPEFELESSEKPKTKKANSRPSKRKGMHPAWMVLSMVTAGLSAICVALMFLWVFFRLDPTGLIAAEPSDADAQNSSQVQVLKNKIDELEKNLEEATQPALNPIDKEQRLAAEVKNLQIRNLKLDQELTEKQIKATANSNPQFPVLDDPELVELIKSWIVEYRVAQQLFESNRWQHHWWHPSAQADWSGNNKVGIQVRMQPVVWQGEEQFYVTDSKSKGSRWNGLFIPQMRPLALLPSGNLAEPSRKQIEVDVEKLFPTSD